MLSWDSSRNGALGIEDSNRIFCKTGLGLVLFDLGGAIIV